jgi:3'(2'), 5'-bisphosphate nucleotidase
MRAALYHCGRLAITMQGQVGAENKAPDSAHQMSTAVTAVDRVCQDILLLQAHEVTPGLAVYSEELAALSPDIFRLFSSHHRYVLVVDPLDGTDEYLRGGRLYAHMLGVLDQESGRMVCGMIYFPADGRLYVGLHDMGAFLSQGLWAPLRPLRPIVPPRTVPRIKRMQESDAAALGDIGWKIVSTESASVHELVRVAEGRVGAALMRQFHGHDTAMAAALLESLGGVVVDGKGEPVRYDRTMERMPLVILSLSARYAEEITAALERSQGSTKSGCGTAAVAP